MKTKKLNKKMELHKTTIVNLTGSLLSEIKGGAKDPQESEGITHCGGCGTRTCFVPCSG
jgi:hypothetical protein